MGQVCHFNCPSAGAEVGRNIGTGRRRFHMYSGNGTCWLGGGETVSGVNVEHERFCSFFALARYAAFWVAASLTTIWELRFAKQKGEAGAAWEIIHVLRCFAAMVCHSN